MFNDRLVNLLLPVAIIVIAGIGYKYFDNDDQIGLNVSGNALREIVDQIRQTTRDKWKERVGRIEQAVTEVEKLRQGRFEQIRSGRQGPAYLDKLAKLSSELHAATPVYDLSPSGVSLWEVFEAAKSAELKLTNHYRDIRAAVNAVKLEAPAADAVAWVKVVQPQRISLERPALEADIVDANDGSLADFKRNVNNGFSELDAMVEHAEKILEKARQTDEEKGGGETIALLSEKDMGSTQGETLRPDELVNDEGTSEGGFNATPGRMIRAEGKENDGTLRNDWMYINKWYVLGPFENRFRINLDSSFLPETVVDLDNVTIGKDHPGPDGKMIKEIRWEYWPSTKQRVEPAFAPRGCIYYGWTELWVEKAGKYWVALGSDDYGKVWINGNLVWTSDTRPKAYRADEHVAEMEFVEGRNTLMFRCENNGGTMGWSVVVGTMPAEGQGG